MMVYAKTALLQTLVAGPAYGAVLKDMVAANTDGRIKLKDASVYPALRALEKAGLLRSWVAPREHGGRPRRLYKLTTAGETIAARDQETAKSLFRIENNPKKGNEGATRW